ncbi:MAG TPA: hypothetical protein VHY31_09915 [Streptosporangiaceae bacterium]|jgi:hypothetical protein|nr:hypothetical protein [Streptosporangiaceae bacterium]
MTDGPLEQLQFPRVLRGLLRVLAALLQEAAMQDPAAGDGQSGLDRVEFTVGRIQGAGLALEQRARRAAGSARSGPSGPARSS